MKKLILLGSKDADGKNDVRDILRYISTQFTDTNVETVFLEDLLIIAETGKQQIIDVATGKDISEADMVVSVNWYKGGPKSLYRDVGFAVALYLEGKGVTFWNSEMRAQRSISKVSAMVQLSLLGMPIPKTYFSLDPKKLVAAVTEKPFVFKSAIASRGADNFVCDNVQEALKHVQADQPNHFIAQEFIHNDADLRVVCFNGEPSLVIERRRTSDDTHLNNTSQGAKATLKKVGELDTKTVEECKKICYNMGREMAGIDILPVNGSDDEYVYLEVNAVPQLTSGSYVDEKMAALAQALKKEKGLS